MPEVSLDGEVTFQRTPDAKAVTGIGQRLAVGKGDQGAWAATTKALQPDLYMDAISVDGADFNDRGDRLFKRAHASSGQSRS